MAQLAQDRGWNQWRNAHARTSYPADWYIEDNEKVSQDVDHQEDEFRLQSILLAWKKRTKQHHLLIGCELACRWDSSVPRVGVDPDVYVAERPPGEDETGYIGSLKTWKEGHHPPLLAIEIVSKSRPKKDYTHSPEKHDLLGTQELWVYDPRLLGYNERQPPVFLQVFQRETNDHLTQVYAGAGPFRSDAVDAWVLVIDGELVIANDREGRDRWPTLEEQERLRADEERRRADEERRRADEERLRADEERLRADEERLRADEAARRADTERRAREEAQRLADEAQKLVDAERRAKEEVQRMADERAKRVEDERAAKDAALARIAELEALLAKNRA